MKTMKEVRDQLHDICLTFRDVIDNEYFHDMQYHVYISLSDICDELEEVYGWFKSELSQLLPTEKPTER